MNEQEEFFVQASIAAALDMSNRDCLKFLKGMLYLAGEHDQLSKVRELVMQRAECDAQLELIAVGQLKFQEMEASR